MKRFKVSEYITPKEAEIIIQSCPKLRDKLILRTMWETGGRVAEVLSLISNNIDSVNNCIYLPNLKQNTIRKKKGETKKEYEKRKEELKEWRKQRKAQIEEKRAPLLDKDEPPLKRIFLFSDSTLCRDLLNYVVENEIERYDWLFQSNTSKSGRVSTTYIWYLLSAIKGGSYSSEKWKRRNGLTTSLRIGKIKGGILKPAWPHLFRHGAAMNIYRRTQRLDIAQKQLGHSTIMTTEGYAELMDEDRKEIIDKS